MERNLTDHIVALSEAIDTVKETTGQSVHLAGYSQGGMFCYQTAAYRRTKDIASIVAFGSPVDTLAALPMGIPPNLGAVAADFMADHVFNRIDIPGWLARTGFQMLDPLKTAKARIDFLFQLHDREALLPREQQRRFLDSRGLDRLVRPGRLRTAQAVHRAQPDDDGRVRDQRSAGDAVRHHLPGAGFRRRGRRHRPAGVGARHQTRRARRRRLRGDDPRRPLRPGRGIARRRRRPGRRWPTGCAGCPGWTPGRPTSRRWRTAPPNPTRPGWR